MPLTETEIRKLELPAELPYMVGDGHNLYLKVYKTGRKTWLFRNRLGGAWRVVKIGNYPQMSLSVARQKAAAMRNSDIPDAITFGQLLQDWFQKRIEPRYRVTKNIEVYVNKGVDGPLGNQHLAQLTTAKLVAELQAYAKTSPVSANRCLSNWKLAFDYAVETGLTQENPLRRTSARVVGGEEKSRDRILNDSEIIALWRSDNLVCKFLLMTGLRIGEFMNGYRKADRWKIDRTKNGDPHWVFITPLAETVLSADPDDLKCTETNIQHKLKRWCTRENLHPFTPHDLRRTFASRMAGIGCPPHIIEKMLNHRMQGVMGIYNRHDYEAERIEWAQKWSDELERVTK